MSTPPYLTLPAGVHPVTVATTRGAFTALTAGPEQGPLALLVPGWTGSKEDFLAVLAPLARAGYRAAAIDQRGQYETPGTPDEADYTLPALADDLLAVAEELSAGDEIHVVGHSFGGLVARTAVIREPAAVTSLGLLCSGPAAVPADLHPLLLALADAVPAMGLPTVWRLKRDFERSQGAPEETPETELFLERRFCANHPVALCAMTRHLVSATDEVEALATTGVPVLVGFGTGDDRWPVTGQREMASRLGARLTVIDGAAHSPAAERPAETASALVEFWADVQTRVRLS